MDYLFQLPLPEAEQFITDCVKRALSSLGYQRPTPRSKAGDASAASEESSSPLLSIREVCRLLRISRPTCIKWRKTGRLKEYRIGRKPYFKAEEVLAALEQVNNSHPQPRTHEAA